MSYKDSAADNFLRTAIKRARKSGKRLVRGACGTYDGCTSMPSGVKMPKTAAVCPLCACLLAEKESTSALTNEFLLEEMAAEALDVSTDWIISMLRGFDGDGYGIENEHPEAYRIGKKLWRDLGEDANGG